MKLLINIKKSIYGLLLILIKIIEYGLIWTQPKSFDISRFGYFVNINNIHNSKITHIHFTGYKTLYELTTSKGKKLCATQDHILPVRCVYEQTTQRKTFLSIYELKQNIKSENYYCVINFEGFSEKIISIEKLPGIHKVFDLTISDKLHVFVANDIKIHNCVTYDTDIEILNDKTSEFEYIPIFELYYSNMKSKNWLMKLEYWLTKLMYKINNKNK